MRYFNSRNSKTKIKARALGSLRTRMSLVLQPVFCLKTVNSFLCWLWFEGGGKKITTCPSRVNPLFCSFYIPDYIYKKNSTTKIHLFIQRRPFLKQSNSAWWKQTELLVGLYFVNKSTNPGVPHGRAHVPDAGPLSSAPCASIIPPVTTFEPRSAGHSSATVRGNRD